MKENRPLKDITGQRFGRLTAIRYEGARIGSYPNWMCQCDCGAQKLVNGTKLRSGHTRSCGCLQRESATRHGKAYTRTYAIWQGMVSRATNPNSSGAKNYVLRGIGVSEEWMKFENFYRDMGDAPPGLTLERKDNEKGYSKGNCVWADRSQQARNQRHPRSIYPGVYRIRETSRWHVRITVDRRYVGLGSFSTYEQAVSARKAAEQLYWK